MKKNIKKESVEKEDYEFIISDKDLDIEDVNLKLKKESLVVLNKIMNEGYKESDIGVADIINLLKEIKSIVNQ
tara:strand:- start:2130 stop:2348 length:219 start_codon:yes stop_codon:yes gene_type:complete